MQKLYKLQKEIKIIEEEYNNICYNLSIFDGEINKAKLLKAKEYTIKKLEYKLLEKEKELEQIKDADVRMIIRLKMQGYRWREISKALNYCTRACREKYYKYLRGMKNGEIKKSNRIKIS